MHDRAVGRDVTAPENILQALVGVHDIVRRRLARLPTDSSPVGINLRGHAQQHFDVTADETIAEELRAHFPDGLILSEESGLQPLGDGPPRWCFLVDPVDGSDNYARTLPLSAVSIAVLEANGSLALSRVRWAMVGGLDQNCPFTAGIGLGCRWGDEPVTVSKVRDLGDAFISCELSHHAPTDRLANLLSRARSVRSYGCASRALALVACGALDAHIDVRNRLTAESFLPGAFMVEQAGGYILDLDGGSFQHLKDLHSTARLVAAATKELAEEIARALGEDHLVTL